MSCPNNEATKLKTQQEDKCKENCNFNFKYNSNSTCKLMNKEDYLEIKTDGKNKVTSNSQGLSLDSVRLYVPSLHTFDGKHTDAELILKHSGGTKNFMVCLPIKTVADSTTGDSVIFFKQFAPHIPLDKNPLGHGVVNVKNWSLNNVMPAPKTPFYHYVGDSPYPPCNMQATMIVFDNKHASTINTSDLELIKKSIKPAKKEGFVGGFKEGFVGGFKEGFVAYNSNGANDTEDSSSSQAMECTEYYDTDPTSTSTSSDDKSTKKPSIDLSKITKSPAFIIIIVLLSILAGGVFFYYVLWPMIRTRLDGVPVASESELKIPEGGGG